MDFINNPRDVRVPIPSNVIQHSIEGLNCSFAFLNGLLDVSMRWSLVDWEMERWARYLV